jgi:hypothetical protein
VRSDCNACNHMLAFFCHVWHVGCVEVCVCVCATSVCGVLARRLRYEGYTLQYLPSSPEYGVLGICPESSLHAAPTHPRTTSPTISLHTKGRARQAFLLGHDRDARRQVAAFAGACVGVELVTLDQR